MLVMGQHPMMGILYMCFRAQALMPFMDIALVTTFSPTFLPAFSPPQQEEQ